MAKSRNGTKRRTTNRARAPPYRNVTPYLAVENAQDAIAWYKKAFGAKEISRNPTPDGKLMHAEILIGDSRVMLSDVFPGSDVSDPRQLGGTAVNLHIYHKDINKLWKKATGAGAQVTMPLENQFWGERYGKIRDPFGHSWAMSYKAKMSKQEMEEKRESAMRTFSTGQYP